MSILLARPLWPQEFGKPILVDGVNDFDDPETSEEDEYLLAIDDGHDPGTEELAPIWSLWNNGIGDAPVEDNWNRWIGPEDDYSANPMEMSKLYTTNDQLYLYIGLVHTDTDGLPAPGGFGYWSTQIGVVVDVNRTPTGGNQSQLSPSGFIDPWHNNEEFFHEHRPDYVVWFDHHSNDFELYHWDVAGEEWNEIIQDSVDSYYPEFELGFFTIYGDDGIPNRDDGPYSGPDKFVEFQIPLRALSIDYNAIFVYNRETQDSVEVSLQAWCTQPGRGAYDTVPTDNQLGHYPSMGDWSAGQDKTDLSQYADYILMESPDTTKPQVLMAEAQDWTHVNVSFNEAMDSASSVNPANYSIANGGDSLVVTVVERLTVHKVRLTTDTQTSGTLYTLTVSSAVTDLAGNGVNPFSNSATFNGFSTGVEIQNWAEGILPEQFALSPNYPNPFNQETTVGYRLNLAERVPVSLNVFNLLGQRVRTLVYAVQGSGEYQVVWNGRDDKGGPLASGVYFLRLKVGQDSQTRKVLLTR